MYIYTLLTTSISVLFKKYFKDFVCFFVFDAVNIYFKNFPVYDIRYTTQ